MTKREIELYFVNKKSALVNSFYLCEGVSIFNNGKNNKQGRFSILKFSDNTEIFFNTLDELWEYEFEGRKVGERIEDMKEFNLTGEQEG